MSLLDLTALVRASRQIIPAGIEEADSMRRVRCLNLKAAREWRFSVASCVMNRGFYRVSGPRAACLEAPKWWVIGLLLLSTVALSGCNLIGGLVQTAASRTSCLGQPCARGRWVLVCIGDQTVYVDPPTDCTFQYTLAFASQTNPIISASVNRADVSLATVTKDGWVHLSTFGEPAAIVDADLDALVVGWSNAGDRLAVVAVGVDSPQAVFLLNRQLNVQQVVPVDLAANAGPTVRFAVSWCSDDGAVVVSSNRRRCVIVTPGREDGIPLTGYGSCYYVGPDTIVAGNVEGETVSLTLRNGVIATEVPMTPPPLRIVTSDPLSGVLLTLEDGIIEDYSPRRYGLRTLHAGPLLFRRVCFENPTLVPIETARPVLEAAGFSVDGPCIDQSGAGGG